MPNLRRPSPSPASPPRSRSAQSADPAPGPPTWQGVVAWLSPRRLFRAVFVDQLRLRRAGSQVVIALETAAPAEAAEPPRAAPVKAQPPSPAARMHAALRQLLDGRGNSREVLRHLAALEQRLGHGDASFMHALSVSTLQSMQRQLQGLVAPPASTDIALLQAELQAALDERRRAAEAEELLRPSTLSFLVDPQPEVTELDPATLDMEFDDIPRPSLPAQAATTSSAPQPSVAAL